MGMVTAGAALALALAQAAAEPAAIDDKYVFFSQPGAARAQVLADFDECRDLSSTVQPPRAGFAYAPNAVAAATTGFLQGLQRGAQRRHMFDAALRKCMNVKGYARCAMTKAEAEALYAGGGWSKLREGLADRALAPVGSAAKLDW